MFSSLFILSYGKYKPLRAPAKCCHCSERSIKSAYHIFCAACVQKLEVCAKCGQKEEIVLPSSENKEEEAKLQGQIEREAKLLPERKRRTFLRKLHEQESAGTTSASWA